MRAERFTWGAGDLIPVITSDYNPYHEPAGTSEGGQFAEAKGGLVAQIEQEVQKKVAEKMAEKPLVMYHGTDSAVEEAILKEGLVPGKGGGGDDWLNNFILSAQGEGDKNGATMAERIRAGSAEITGRDASVYVTPDKNFATAFARHVSEVAPGSKPVLFRVKIPKNDPKLKPDEFAGSGFRYEGTITPDKIDVVPHAEWERLGGGVLVAAGGRDAANIVFYVIVVADGSVADFNPYHEPAGSEKGGQFAKAPAGAGTPEEEEKEETLSKEEQLARFKKLKAEWARINDELLQYMDNPGDPRAQELMDACRVIVKEIHGLDVDPGGLTDIGLPGGPRDVAIVGAGPGGLASAIMGGAEGLDTLLIEASATPGGQAKASSRIENYPGFPAGTTGESLANNMYEQATRMGAETMLGVSVTGLDYDPATGMKTLTLSNGETVTARSVILAGGVQFNRLDFDGSTRPGVVYGDGKTVANMAAGANAVIIGGSNGAAQAALGAARTASHVTMISRSPIGNAMSDYQVQAVLNHPKISVIENDQIKSYSNGVVTTNNGYSVPAKAVGVFVGSAPNTSYVPAKILSQSGRVVVNGDLETSIPGVYAVGDVREGGIGRIGGAVGDGQMAVKNVYGYFEQVQNATTPVE